MPMSDKPTYEELEKKVLDLEVIELELTRTEVLLKDEIQWRRLLIEQSRDPIVILDQNAKVYDTNSRFADMLGYSREEVYQLYAWDWDALYEKEQILELASSVDAGGHHFETKHRRKDGRIIDVELSNNGATYGGKKLIFCICRDITERKHMEEELRQSRDELEKRVEERTQELENKSRSIEELNVALSILLSKVQEEKERVEERLVSNVEKLVLPYVERIRKGRLDEHQRLYLDIINTNLHEIISPLLRNIRQLNLTPREAQVADLIKEGKSSKEIAAIIGLATNAIDSYRNSIRRKLGLNKVKTSLQSYLQSFK
jgi:PAS domain S-box-containing protein